MPAYSDPIELLHWLWWKNRCHEASGEEFQHLFEEVMKRAEPDFLPVRPYGKMGDLKCDGLLFGNGTVYQVYSPDELKQAAMTKKVKADLAGAVEHWGENLHEWVFVYNVRRGAPPDVAKTLKLQERKYPGVKLRHLSSDALWEIARGLSAQQRSEILGAPSGFEHMFLMPSALPEEARQRLKNGRFVLIQDVMNPINALDAAAAMDPELAYAPPLYITPETGGEWAAAAAFQAALVDEAIRRSRDLLPRFAVFSLAPIPLAIHLGYLLSDRVEVRLFQFDRDRRTWAWPSHVNEADTDFEVRGVPATRIAEPVEVALRISLSARVTPAQSAGAVGALPVEIDLAVARPEVMWLRHPDQLRAFAVKVREVLGAIRDQVPNCRRVHLFYAGPTGGAIKLGQAINPRMNAPVSLYEFDYRKTPSYTRALDLN